jgi:hypothetical protein
MIPKTLEIRTGLVIMKSVQVVFEAIVDPLKMSVYYYFNRMP